MKIVDRWLLALVKESSRSAPRIELPFRNERLAPRISSLRFVCPPSRFLCRLPVNLLAPHQDSCVRGKNEGLFTRPIAVPDLNFPEVR